MQDGDPTNTESRDQLLSAEALTDVLFKAIREMRIFTDAELEQLQDEDLVGMQALVFKAKFETWSLGPIITSLREMIGRAIRVRSLADLTVLLDPEVPNSFMGEVRALLYEIEAQLEAELDTRHALAQAQRGEAERQRQEVHLRQMAEIKAQHERDPQKLAKIAAKRDIEIWALRNLEDSVRASTLINVGDQYIMPTEDTWGQMTVVAGHELQMQAFVQEHWREALRIMRGMEGRQDQISQALRERNIYIDIPRYPSRQLPEQLRFNDYAQRAEQITEAILREGLQASTSQQIVFSDAMRSPKSSGAHLITLRTADSFENQMAFLRANL